MTIEERAARFAKGNGRPIPRGAAFERPARREDPPKEDYQDEEPGPRPRRRSAEPDYYEEEPVMERPYYPREHGGGFIWKLAGIAFILSVTAMTLYRLGVLDALLSPPGVPLPAPTPIVRVVDPYRDVTRPVEAPPTVMPAQAAPAVSAPQAAPGAAEPTPAVTLRQPSWRWHLGKIWVEKAWLYTKL